MKWDLQVQHVLDAWEAGPDFVKTPGTARDAILFSWPALGEALNVLAETCPANVKHHRGPGTGTCVYCGKQMPAPFVQEEPR